MQKTEKLISVFFALNILPIRIIVIYLQISQDLHPF